MQKKPVIFLVLVMVIIAGVWIVTSKKEPSVPFSKDDQEKAQADETAGWQAYSKYGFSVSYPENWVMIGKDSGNEDFGGPIIASKQVLRDDGNGGWATNEDLLDDKANKPVETLIYLTAYSSLRSPALAAERSQILDLQQFLDLHLHGADAKISKITFNGMEAFEEASINAKSGDSQYRIWIENKGKIYEIFFPHRANPSEFGPEEKKILSTFRLAD
jgi:hypothetical protein